MAGPDTVDSNPGPIQTPQECVDVPTDGTIDAVMQGIKYKVTFTTEGDYCTIMYFGDECTPADGVVTFDDQTSIIWGGDLETLEGSQQGNVNNLTTGWIRINMNLKDCARPPEARNSALLMEIRPVQVNGEYGPGKITAQIIDQNTARIRAEAGMWEVISVDGKYKVELDGDYQKDGKIWMQQLDCRADNFLQSTNSNIFLKEEIPEEGQTVLVDSIEDAGEQLQAATQVPDTNIPGQSENGCSGGVGGFGVEAAVAAAVAARKLRGIRPKKS